MKSFGKTKATSTDVNTSATPTGAVISDASVRPPRFKKIPRGVLISLALLVVVGGVGYYLWNQRPVRVGNHTVSKQDVSNAVAAQKRAMIANGSKDTSSAEKEAQNQVILLAGLKTEADKRGIHYAESDIDSTVLKESITSYGTKEKYLSYMKATYDWGKEDVYRTRTIEYLEQKMQDELLSTRSYSLTFVRWDNIKQLFPNSYQKIYDEKEAILKTKHLPLYQQKASTATLAKSAELVMGMSKDEEFAVYQNTAGVPIVNIVETFGPGHSIDGIEKYPEGEDLATKLTSLQHIGDFTGPFKSNDGTLVIARLETSKGGNFASWSSLTSYYQKKSGLTFAPSRASQSFGKLATSLQHAGSLFTAQAASAAAADCLVTHGLDYYVVYRDYDTAALISTANTSVYAQVNRSKDNCTESGYTSRGYAVGAVSGYPNTFSVSKTFRDNNAGTMHVLLDCNGNSWNINDTNTGVVVAISGYTHKSTTFPSGQTSAFPWYPGINSSGAFTTTVAYRKNPPPPSGSITCTPMTNYTVKLNYSWSNAPGGITVKRTTPAGTLDTNTVTSGSDNYTDTSLYIYSSFTYTLRHGSAVLDTITCSPLPTPTGSVNCTPTGPTSIKLDYSYGGVSGTTTIKRTTPAATLVSSAAAFNLGTTYSDSGRLSSTSYTYTLANGSTTLDTATCTTDAPVASGGGTISCAATSSSDISINYSWSGLSASGVSVKKDNFLYTTYAGASGSTSFNDGGNAASSAHKYDLYNGSALLSTMTCTTQATPPSSTSSIGAVSCSPTGPYDISVSYSWSSAPSSGVTISKDGGPYTFGSGTSGDGSFGDGGNSPSSTHTYSISDGSSTLDSATCTTYPPPPIPPSVSVGAGNCISGFDVFASDPDSSGSELQLHVTSIGFDVSSYTSGQSYHVAIPASLIDGTRHYFSITAYGVDTSGYPDGTDGYGSTMLLACGNFSTNPTTTNKLTPDDEAPTGYQVSGTVNITSGLPSASFNMTCSQTATFTSALTGVTSTIGGPTSCNSSFASGSYGVTGPSGPVATFMAGDKYCATIQVQYASGVVQEGGQVLSSTGPNSGSTSCDYVTNKPYFKIINSSAAVGGVVGACTSAVNTGVLSSWFNNTNAANNYGASAQLGAYALAHIAGFASNQTSPSNSPSELSFANVADGSSTPSPFITTDNNSPYLGGSQNGRNCITAPAVEPIGTVSSGGSGLVNLNGFLNPGHSHIDRPKKYGGNLRIKNNNRPVEAGDNVAFYVAGDIFIEDNIIYDTTGWTAQTIPSMLVVATGNIYIDPSVTQLDGTYEAGGKIVTCATASGAITPTNLYDTCKNKLIVNGSFVAKKIELLRTYGSLRDEARNLAPPGSLVTCDSASGPAVNQPNCAAEVFQFSPEHYLERPAARVPGAGMVQYDAITSLPPVL